MTHDAYLASLRATGHSKETIRTYRAALRALDEFQGAKSVHRATLAEFVEHLSGRRRLKPASLRLYATVATSAFDYARKRQGLAIPEQIEPTFPRHKRREFQVVIQDLQQHARLVQEIARIPERQPLLVLAGGGLRISELWGVSGIETHGGHTWLRVGHGKSMEPRLTPLFLWDTQSCRYVDTNVATYKQFSRTTLRNKLRDIGDRIGVKGLHPHALRHSYATLLNNLGIAPNHIQAFMGHEHFETTRRYISRTPTATREAFLKQWAR